MNLNLASVKVKRSPKYWHARFAFRCGCRALVDLESENLSELRFCRKEECPSSAYAQEVYDEYLSVERRRLLMRDFQITTPEEPSKLFIPGEGNTGSATETLAALTRLMEGKR